MHDCHSRSHSHAEINKPEELLAEEEFWLDNEMSHVYDVFLKVRADDSFLALIKMATNPGAVHQFSCHDFNKKSMQLRSGRFEMLLAQHPELRTISSEDRKQLVVANFPRARLVCFSRSVGLI